MVEINIFTTNFLFLYLRAGLSVFHCLLLKPCYLQWQLRQ